MEVPRKILIEAVTGNQRPLMMILKNEGVIKVKKKPEADDPPNKGDVQQVWDHWVEVFGHLHDRRLKLTAGRRRVIRARLKTFSVADLKAVIDYILTDEWWMGGNDRSTGYYFPENVFRNDERVEKLLLKASDDIATKELDAHVAAKLKLQIGEQAAMMRSGDVGLGVKQDYVKLVKRVEGLTGESFDWERHEFKS